MAERTVRHALFTYRDADGVRQTAFRGDKVDLDGKELARAERLEAVAEGDLDRPSAATVVEPLTPDVVLAAVPAQPVEASKPAAAADKAGDKPAARRPAGPRD